MSRPILPVFDVFALRSGVLESLVDPISGSYLEEVRILTEIFLFFLDRFGFSLTLVLAATPGHLIYYLPARSCHWVYSWLDIRIKTPTGEWCC